MHAIILNYVVPIAIIYVCQHYTYGMASMQVTLWGIVSLLTTWHNTTSLDTKPVSCVPPLTLIPWYATTISTIWNDTYLCIYQCYGMIRIRASVIIKIMACDHCAL